MNRRTICEPTKNDNTLEEEYSKYNITPVRKILIKNTLFKCKFCNKKLSTPQTLKKHTLICKKHTNYNEIHYNVIPTTITFNSNNNNTNDGNNNNLNNSLLSIIKKQEMLIEKQYKAFNELLEKTNNIHNNSRKNDAQDKIIPFSESDDYVIVDDEDFLECINQDKYHVINLIKKIHFNINKPEINNIYVSNFRNNSIMTFDGIKWILSDDENILSELFLSKYFKFKQKIDDWIELGINKRAVAKFKKHQHENDNELNNIILKRKLKYLLYNNTKY